VCLGCGKSTFVEALSKNATLTCHYAVIALSLDDFYYTFEEQQLFGIGSTNSNPYLRGRGVPGTHDIAFMQSTLKSLLAMKDLTKLARHPNNVLIPKFDKSLRNGFGDRIDRKISLSDVNHDGKPVLILFEGWFIGLSSTEEKPLTNPYQNDIQKQLKNYEKVWSLIDAFIFIQIPDLTWIYDWRWEQEVEQQQNLKACKTSLSKKQVNELVDRCKPFYTLFSPMKTQKTRVFIELDKFRKVTRRSILNNAASQDDLVDLLAKYNILQ
jgi:D-glycerate 3-kinase